MIPRVLAFLAMVLAACAPGYKHVTVIAKVGLHRPSGEWRNEASSAASTLPVQASCDGQQMTWMKVRSVDIASAPSSLNKIARIRVSLSSDHTDADMFYLPRDSATAGLRFVGAGERIELPHPRAISILAEGPPSLPDEALELVRATIELEVACYRQVLPTTR